MMGASCPSCTAIINPLYTRGGVCLPWLQVHGQLVMKGQVAVTGAAAAAGAGAAGGAAGGRSAAAAAAEDDDIFGDAGTDYAPAMPQKKGDEGSRCDEGCMVVARVVVWTKRLFNYSASALL